MNINKDKNGRIQITKNRFILLQYTYIDDVGVIITGYKSNHLSIKKQRNLVWL